MWKLGRTTLAMSWGEWHATIPPRRRRKLWWVRYHDPAHKWRALIVSWPFSRKHPILHVWREYAEPFA